MCVNITCDAVEWYLDDISLDRIRKAEWNDAAAKRNVKSQRSIICPHRMAVACGAQRTTLTEISLEISGFLFDLKAHNRGEKGFPATSCIQEKLVKKEEYTRDMFQKFSLMFSL